MTGRGRGKDFLRVPIGLLGSSRSDEMEKPREGHGKHGGFGCCACATFDGLFFSRTPPNTCAARMRRPMSCHRGIIILRLSAVSSQTACVQHMRPCLSVSPSLTVLHISPGGEQHRSEDHITEAESCNSRLTDPSFPPLL